MASIKQATSASLELLTIVPLATASITKSLASTAVSTVGKAGTATDKVLDSVNLSLDIAYSELELIHNRTLAENKEIMNIEKEYFKTDDFKTRVTAMAMARYKDEDTELTF